MDYRFKISGSSEPFKAELYSGATLIQQKPVYYSGTCVIFNGLNTGTTYNYSISDRINQITSGSFTTPNTQVQPTELPEKTFSLLGTAGKPSSGPPTGTFCYLVGSKFLEITPSLSAGNCATINLNVILDSGVSGEVNSDVRIYKSCNGSSYVLQNTYTTAGSYTPSYQLGVNDSICYNMSSIIDTGGLAAGTYTGCAQIILDSINSVNGTFDPVIDPAASAVTTNINYSVATTTSTTTLPQVQIGLINVTPSETNNVCTVTANLYANPPLQSNQCVELCFTNEALTQANELVGSLSAIGTLFDDFNNINKGQVSASQPSFTIGSDSDSCYDSIVLKANNINNITISLSATLSQIDEIKDACSCAAFGFNQLDKQCCGSFSWSGTLGIKASKVGNPTNGGGTGGGLV